VQDVHETVTVSVAAWFPVCHAAFRQLVTHRIVATLAEAKRQAIDLQFSDTTGERRATRDGHGVGTGTADIASDVDMPPRVSYSDGKSFTGLSRNRHGVLTGASRNRHTSLLNLGA